MEIASIEYNDKRTLIIYLGELDGKIFALDAILVPDSERSILINKAYEVQNMPLNMIINWLKTMCPISYKTCFKTYISAKIKIFNKYNLNVRV